VLKRALLPVSLLLLVHGVVWGIQAPIRETMTRISSSLPLPSTIEVVGFIAIDDQGRRSTDTGLLNQPFKGKVRLTLQQWIAGVVRTEIDVAGEIDDGYLRPILQAQNPRLTSDQLDDLIRDVQKNRRWEAYRAQAQTALNILLWRIKVKDPKVVNLGGGVYQVPGGLPGDPNVRETVALQVNLDIFFDGTGQPLGKSFAGNLSSAARKAALKWVASSTTQIFDTKAEISTGGDYFGIFDALDKDTLAKYEGSAVSVLTLGDHIPLNLPYIDGTSYGFTSDNNVTAAAPWFPCHRAQPSPEYAPGVYGNPGMPNPDTRTDQVGMSQKGLIHMAADGISATSILDHYYHFLAPFVQGVEILQIHKPLEDKLINNRYNAGPLRDLFFSDLSSPNRTKGDPPVLGIRRAWMRGKVDPHSPMSATRYLEATNQPGIFDNTSVGIAVYFQRQAGSA